VNGGYNYDKKAKEKAKELTYRMALGYAECAEKDCARGEKH